MFYINIDPYFHIGSLDIPWTAIGLALAMAVTIILGIPEAKRRGITIRLNGAAALCIVFIAGVFIGGKLFYLLDNWNRVISYPEHFVHLSGIVIYGVVIGAVAAIAIYLKARGLSFWAHGDAVAPGAMLGMSLYRIGCILCGCCYGLPSNSTCSVAYVNPDSFAPTNIAIYPTQVYHLILGLLTFVILWILRNRLKPEGALFLLWLILFSAGDLAVRFFRVANPFIFNWQLAQIVDIAILAVTIPWFAIKTQSYRTSHNIS